MLTPVVLFLIPYLISPSHQMNFTAKCCKSTHEVQVSKSVLRCSATTNTRLQINAKEEDFLQTASEGECVDFEKDQLFLFKFKNSTLETKTAQPNKFVPKCCPLKHLYNRETRSCIKAAENYTESVLENNQFVKVGLPQCRVIVDEIFLNSNEMREWTSKVVKGGSYCYDQDVNRQFVVRECREGLNVCEEKRCFKKCCPDGQSYVEGAHCKDTYVQGIQLKGQRYSPYIVDIDDDFEVLYGVGCPNVSIRLNNTIQYTIQKNGSYTFYHNFTSKFEEHHYSKFNSYCLEYATKNNKSYGYHLFVCFESSPLESKFALTLWSKIVSCICLLMTIIVYFVLGEHKSTFGKILINYCVAMICLMTTLTVAHLDRKNTQLECKIRGYLLIFFNISAFAWVNVMSLDIWWTFGTPKRTIGSAQKKKDLKKFFLYFIYGWGLPLFHSLLILIFDTVKVLPESIQPHVGIFKCFLENRNYSRTIFFLIPQLTFQMINIGLFIKTIVYCIKVKNEIRKMNDSVRTGKYNADKGRLVLVVKLAVIMGIVWTCEVATAFFDNMKEMEFTRKLEIVMDTITCLQGVFIFLIFICKKRTTTGLKNKLGFGGKRNVGGSMSVTQTSQVNGHYPMTKTLTSLSMTECKS
ncbi:G-protein coupled receptor Mth2-like [Euwallacea fornicatus]|uniref:G-protein coupled receptor Mth2-like n=1 Tax=Euwallacea fornicatus TaxID=995702 RepID=UPI00339057B6